MDTLQTCSAKSKQSKQRCKNFAVRWREVCHIHGSKTPRQNPRPKTEAGRQRQKMASWKHGKRTQEYPLSFFSGKRLDFLLAIIRSKACLKCFYEVIG